MRNKRAAREKNLVFRRTGNDSKPRRPRMRGQLAPFDLVWILVIDFSHPALIGCDGFAARIFLCAIHIHDGVVCNSSSMPEHRRAGYGGRLAPSVSLRVIDLYDVHWPILGTAANQVNVAVVRHTDHRAVDRGGNILRAIPAVFLWNIRVYVG